MSSSSRFTREARALDPRIKNIVVDEIQKVPSLLDEIQSLYDEHKTRFQIFLTGSSARRLRRQSANLLPGRSHTFRLSPVCLWEAAGPERVHWPGAEPATRANVLAAVEWLATDSRRDDLAVFVFLGQGGPLGDKSDRRCYFTTDSVFKDRARTAVAAAEIGERLQKLESRRFCAFLDVNFKGFVADKTVVEPTLGESPYRELLGEDKADEHASSLPGRVAFLATNGLSGSLDHFLGNDAAALLVIDLGTAAPSDPLLPDWAPLVLTPVLTPYSYFYSCSYSYSYSLLKILHGKYEYEYE